MRARLGQKAGNAKHHFNFKNKHSKRERHGISEGQAKPPDVLSEQWLRVALRSSAITRVNGVRGLGLPTAHLRRFPAVPECAPVSVLPVRPSTECPECG